MEHGNHLRSFSVIASLPADATTFTDNPTRPGFRYHYRVQAIDEDEVSAYSQEVTLRTADNDTAIISLAINLYANPASRALTISTDSQHDKRIKFQITDMSGKVIEKFELAPGENQVQLDVSQLREGLYILESQGADTCYRQRLIIDK